MVGGGTVSCAAATDRSEICARRFHLIEEQFLRHAVEVAKGRLETLDQRPHVLAYIEPAPEQGRVAEDDEQRVADVPRKLKSREIDLRFRDRPAFRTE